MKVTTDSKFFNWLGTASVGTLIGVLAGLLLGAVIGGGLGGWFWYYMRNDGINTTSDDIENIFGFCVTVALAVFGAIVGLVGGAVAGLIASSFVSAISSASRSAD